MALDAAAQTDGRKDGIAQEGIGAVVDKILEDAQTEHIAGIIEIRVIEAYVLAQGVKAKGFCGIDVAAVSVWGGREIDAVGIVALVKQTVEPMRLAVQTKYIKILGGSF